ncbi:winged helix-turn-helix domain-containing protein [Vibrio paucivorans]|uniref:winged helix-turn-helix domain-containing protein n=1 Tax=Vibrio paucivorans TaxID=2829489 RepID=UPI0036F2CF39
MNITYNRSINLIYRFGNKTFYFQENMLVDDTLQSKVNLRSKESTILKLLLENYPNVVSREQLKREVWEGTYATDLTLNQTINYLRKSLGDKGLVETKPKIGYKFTVEVTYLSDAPPPQKNNKKIKKHHQDTFSCKKHTLTCFLLVVQLLLTTLLITYKSPFIYELKNNKSSFDESKREAIIMDKNNTSDVYFFDRFKDKIYKCQKDGQCLSI